MNYSIEYYKEKDTDPMVFLQRFRCTTEPIGGGTEPDEEGELVSWDAAVAAIEIAKKHLCNDTQFQDFKKEVEKLREIDDAEEYAKQLAHLFLGNGLSLQTILLMAIEFGQQHPAWVSVEERLPPRAEHSFIFSDYVLVCDNNGYMDTACYNFEKNRWDWLNNVTHWMPLPQSPVKGGEDEND